MLIWDMYGTCLINCDAEGPPSVLEVLSCEDSKNFPFSDCIPKLMLDSEKKLNTISVKLTVEYPSLLWAEYDALTCSIKWQRHLQLNNNLGVLSIRESGF